jgi:large subunit ribosomal protein L18
LKLKKIIARESRHKRIRKKISGTSQKPRMCIYKSNKHIYVQLIDDSEGITLTSASTVEKDFSAEIKPSCNIANAKKIGSIIADRAKLKGINTVVFDRGGYIYHGRIKALADSAREKGLIL